MDETPEHRGLLVWDSFRAHLTDGVKDLLDRRNVDVAVIPGGLTPVLQPLDKCINKPFKAKVCAQYEAWMVNSPFTYTPSRKKRAPGTNELPNKRLFSEPPRFFLEPTNQIKSMRNIVCLLFIPLPVFIYIPMSV